LNVSDNILKHLPQESYYWGKNVAPWSNQVTIHHLLTHTSGIGEYIGNLNLNVYQSHKDVNRDILEYAASQKLKFTPGSIYDYNNTGYVILGLIIEQISGKNLAQFFNDEFFSKLDMKNTKLLDLETAVKHQTGKMQGVYPERYFVLIGGQEPVFKPAQGPLLAPFADGGVISCADDISKWMHALYSGKVISHKSLELMTSKHVKTGKQFIGGDSYYGYGININNFRGRTIYWHGGNAIGIRGEYFYIKELDSAIIGISNVNVSALPTLEEKVDFGKAENQMDVMYFVLDLLNFVNM
jgi:CubicO group peptidase (beta-lactamase class C family)